MFFVYRILNQQTGKQYIGQSVNPHKRWADHVRMVETDDEHCQYIHRAIRKYGVQAFAFEVLEEHLTQEAVNAAEVRLIQENECCNPEKGYNLKAGGQGEAPDRDAHRGGILTYREARAWCRELGVRSIEEYAVERAAGLVKLPVQPSTTYRGDWAGWSEFLGLHFTYEECSVYAYDRGVISEAHWDQLWRAGELDKRAPHYPKKMYLTHWKSWPAFVKRDQWVIKVVFSNPAIEPMEVRSLKDGGKAVRRVGWQSGGATLQVKGTIVARVLRSGHVSPVKDEGSRDEVQAPTGQRGRPIGSKTRNRKAPVKSGKRLNVIIRPIKP